MFEKVDCSNFFWSNMAIAVTTMVTFVIGSLARHQFLQDIGISPPVFSRLFIAKLFVYRVIIAAHITIVVLMTY